MNSGHIIVAAIILPIIIAAALSFYKDFMTVVLPLGLIAGVTIGGIVVAFLCSGLMSAIFSKALTFVAGIFWGK